MKRCLFGESPFTLLPIMRQVGKSQQLLQKPLVTLISSCYLHNHRIFCTDGTTELGRVQAFDKSVENTKKFGDASDMIEMGDWDDTLAKFPFLDYDKSESSNIDKSSFRAVFNRNAGWVDPVIAMQRVRDYCKHHGVRFSAGDRGTIVNLIRDKESRVTGVEAKDGTKYTAGRVILAMGAYSDTLLDYESQLEAVRQIACFRNLRLTHNI
jgi:sarcosine oxidase/L-pipecolate oxidase